MQQQFTNSAWLSTDTSSMGTEQETSCNAPIPGMSIPASCLRVENNPLYASLIGFMPSWPSQPESAWDPSAPSKHSEWTRVGISGQVHASMKPTLLHLALG